MNKNKTGGILVGKLKHSKDKIEGIKWYEKPIKTLGAYFGNNIPYEFETFTFNFFSIFVWHDTCTSSKSKYRYD
jgi:hypothetical protein